VNKITQYTQLLANMGLRYVAYRLFYELKRKSGALKWKFPAHIQPAQLINLSEWKTISKPFFFQSREDLQLEKKPNNQLKESFENAIKGKIQFFSSGYFDLGTDYDWIKNPETGYKYDIRKHWTEINDFSKEAGDIKYVWEKSRFSFLYTIIRYDYHFNKDHSEFVFQQITDWIEKNPLNFGPNYKCSQEISLRLLNWIFALYFYKNASVLTEAIFQKIIQSIYWQLHHVYKNIRFSKITVRNNHALTETLALYIIPTLFPQFPNASGWKRKGKKWFEEEVAYQIYEDGTFLQFSMNYHRVAVQLLTWAIKVSELNNETLAPVVYDRAYKSIDFLYQCQEDSNGYLPNYGSNDGALFFKLSDNNYRDYRPQLNALHILLTGKSLYPEASEDVAWYGAKSKPHFNPLKKQFGICTFELGGYFLIREADTLTFIRCGKHFDRPAHADNLHIDIWYKGENVLLDGGSYQYNTEEKLSKYFVGTASHNTVMLGDEDQMLKGSRFIWYYWSQAIEANLEEQDEYYEFSGKISCFRQLSGKIVHGRFVRKIKGKPEWIVTDVIENKPDSINICQMWHTLSSQITFKSTGKKSITKGLFSDYYGKKEDNIQIEFETKEQFIKTNIQII
jgi:outer membrane protein assembly factor BamB